MSVRFAVVLLGCSSCGGSELPVDCSTVGNGVKTYWNERAETTTDPAELAAIAETSKIGIEKFERHCRDDQWNADMIKCARIVFRLEDSGCLKFLSPGQKKKWEQGDQTPVPGGIRIGG